MNYLAQLTYIWLIIVVQAAWYSSKSIPSEWICLENKYKMMLSSGNFKGEIANGVGFFSAQNVETIMVEKL